jgi:hypothetical protein
MANPAKLDALLRGIAGQAPEAKYIRAYHGSPYDFDRFEASKIGSGEGRASHGHGYYLTKANDLAEYYRPKGGRVYEVEIPRRQDELLDWGTPVLQQPQQIQDAIRELLDREAVYLKGGKAYDQIAKHYGDGLSDSRASDLLFERGIFGNTFLGARQADGMRARNYVMFPGTEDSIRILRKYGIMAPIAASAASAGGQQQAEVQ